MPDRERGLFGKYRVDRVDGKPFKGGMCIVLEVGDPNAWPALLTWADTVEADGYAVLAADVRETVATAKRGVAQFVVYEGEDDDGG